jgi:hypothetical protein
MGRKQNRKRARRQRAKASSSLDYVLPPPGVDPWAPPPDPYDFGQDDETLMAFFAGRRPAGLKTCGNCREFIEDGEFGRGTCLHPGSGVLSPWETSPACDFFAARRR